MYPLRELLKEAWNQIGVDYFEDGNRGEPCGLMKLAEAWDEGKRQVPSEFRDLSKENILIWKVVGRVDIKRDRIGKVKVTGVILSDGIRVAANEEVVISAGAYHTPQTSMLSGIGSAEVLKKYGIAIQADNKKGGKNLSDHLSLGITWKLKDPERSLAMGSPNLPYDPSFGNGFPMDFIQFGHVPDSAFKRTTSSRSFIAYVPMGNKMAGVDAAMDGSHITSVALCLTPTSQGTVSIRSAYPEDATLIDQNANDTESDRRILREGLKQMARVLTETPAGKSSVLEEVTPEGYAPILPTSSKEEIDVRIRDFGYRLDHPMRSCAMGKMVNTKCRVIGADGLRVVDASVIPMLLACHIQAAVYSLLARAADDIAGGS